MPRLLVAGSANLRLLVEKYANNLVGQAGMSFAIRLTRFGLGLITSIIFARLLAPTQYGIYSYVLTIIALLGIPVEAGIPQLLIREIARYRAQNAFDRVRGAVVAGGQVFFAFMAITAVVGLVVVLALRPRLPENALLIAALAVPAVALGGMSNVRGAILRGLGSPVVSQIPEQIVRPAMLVIIGLVAMQFARHEATAVDAMTMTISANAVAFVVGAVLLRRVYVREVGPGPKLLRRKDFVVSLAPFTILAGVQVASSQISLFLSGFFLHPSEIAQLRIAMLCADVVSFPIFALNTLLAPKFSSLYHTGKIPELQKLSKNSSRLCVAMSFCTGLPFLLFGRQIIELAYGHEYAAVTPALRIMVIGQILSAAYGSVATLANMSGFEKQTLLAVGLGLLISSVLTVVLAPAFGAIGAAMGMLISLLIWRAILSGMFYKSTGVSSFAI